MTAQPSTASTVKQQVIFLVLEGVELLDLAGPAQVFSIAASLGAPYSLHFCGNIGGVRSAQGLFLGQLELLPSVEARDLIVVAGVALDQLNQSLLDATTRDWIIDAHAKGTCIASICTGAIVLGEAGLLNGRRCTTHWFVIQDLQRDFALERYGVPGGVVLHTPGHTSGSVSALLPNGNVLAGDLVIGGVLIGGIVRLRHARKPPFEDDPITVRQSLIQLLDRGASRFYVGHGGPLTAAAVRKYIAREPRLAASVTVSTSAT